MIAPLIISPHGKSRQRFDLKGRTALRFSLRCAQLAERARVGAPPRTPATTVSASPGGPKMAPFCSPAG